MTVGLSNTDLGNGLLDSYDGFTQMLRHLDASVWTTPTRCTGWEVRDIAGHVVGLANDAATGVPGTRTPDEQAAALRDSEPGDLAEQLAAHDRFAARLDECARRRGMGGAERRARHHAREGCARTLVGHLRARRTTSMPRLASAPIAARASRRASTTSRTSSPRVAGGRQRSRSTASRRSTSAQADRR